MEIAGNTYRVKPYTPELAAAYRAKLLEALLHRYAQSADGAVLLAQTFLDPRPAIGVVNQANWREVIAGVNAELHPPSDEEILATNAKLKEQILASRNHQS